MLISPRYEGSPIIAIEGPVNDQLLPATRQRRRLASLLADLGPTDWTTPSRCAGWTVQDVIAHLVGTNTFWQLSVESGLAGTPTQVLQHFDPAATPPLGVDRMRGLTPAEVLDQFVSTNEALLAAIAGLTDTEWSMPAESPAGHVPMHLVVQHALWDCWVHERDIAVPIGIAPVVEDDEVASCLRYAAAISPALAIGFGKLATGTFAVEATEPDICFVLHVGDAVAVRDGHVADDVPCLRGDAVALVEALSIRAPMPPSAPPEWRQLLAGLATAFDTA